MSNTRSNGFTIIEVAIVFVIIGLILGLAFKGRDLIAGARVKNTYAGASRIQAALVSFHERQGRLPGDGCNNAAPATASACNGLHDGLLNTAAEQAAFWHELQQQSALLSASDRNMPLGQQWTLVSAGTNLGSNTPANWMVAGPDGTSGVIDVRYACELDNLYDDGNPSTGNIRSSAEVGSGAGQYHQGDDCWNPAKAAMKTLAFRLL